MHSYLQTFLVFSAAAATVLAAPVGSATCPTRDDAGGALIESILQTNGQFLDCRYQKAGRCSYFVAEGSFSSGSSVCPDSASAASAPSSDSSSSESATCVATDDAGGALLSSSDGPIGFVSCKYQVAGTCGYFSPGGQFSSGASICPDSITAAGSSSPPGATANLKSSPALSTGYASSFEQAQCVSTDDSGSALQIVSLTSDGFVVCLYQAAGSCVYFSPGGQFSSGSSTCPDSITPAGSPPTSGTNDASTGSASSPDLAQCVATDDTGSTLQSSRVTADGFVACSYQAAGNCEYFSPGGQFSAGASTCPNSITPGGGSSSSGTNDSSSGSAPGTALAQCVATDDAGSALQSSNVTADGFVACDYQTAKNCEYFTPGGEFSAGASTCPDSITPADTTSASGAIGVGTFLADTDDSGSSSESSKKSGIPQPAIIALLALNALLVVGVLAAGSWWLWGRRGATNSSYLKTLYTSVDTSRDTTVPLTHGASQGPYYDPRETKTRSIFETD
ncbi:hypothetical protein FB451DRAFT_790903 [Mycena latifolia]|nr:hypothetical protein FB451DRAFT_790903 [Mycena latifolia]